MSVLNEAAIRGQTDVYKLQEICITLTRVQEKESASKKKYRDLCAQMQQTLQQKQMELECSNKKIETLNQLLQSADNSPKTNNDELEALQLKCQTLQSMLDDQNRLNSEAEIKFKQSNTEQTQIIESQTNKIQQLEQEISQLNLKIQNQDNSISSLQLQLKSTSEKNNIEEEDQKESQKYKGILDDMQNQITDLTNKNIDYQNIISTQKQEKEAIEKELHDTKEELDHKTDEITILQTDFNKVSFEFEDLQNQKAEVDTKLIEINSKYENQKSIIERMTGEQNQLVQLIETNNTKAKNQINQLKLQIKELTANNQRENEEKQNENEELENEIKSLKETVETKSNEINQLNKEITKLKDEISKLNETIQNQNHEIESFDRKTLIHDKTNLAYLKTADQLKTKQLKLIQTEEELKLKNTTLENLEKFLSEKDDTISKLKVLLSRSMKNEERSESVIQEKNKAIEDLESQISSLRETTVSNEAMEELQKENEELRKQLSEVQISAESKQQLLKTTQLLEKSNQMYLELKAENKKLAEQAIRRQVYLNQENFDIIDVLPKGSEDDQIMISDKIVKITYLRRVLLQFFTDDEATRLGFIPMILDLVGCNKEQAAAVYRQYQRSTGIIARTASALGY